MKNRSIRIIAYAGILAAIGIVLKTYLGIHFVELKNLSLAPVPIILGGIMFGPVVGGLIGAVVDVAGYLIKPAGGYLPPFTVTMILYGVIPSLFYFKTRAKNSFTIDKTKNTRAFVKLLLVVLLSVTVCSVILNTLWIAIFYGASIAALAPTRVISALVSWPAYTIIIFILIKYTARIVARQPDRNINGKKEK